MYEIAWHQRFSNYENLRFDPNDQREIIRIKQNLSGSALRIEWSNEFDECELKVNELLVSLDADFSHSKNMKFNGKERFSIPPGQKLWTDALQLEVPDKADLYLAASVSNEAGWLKTSAHLFSKGLLQTNMEGIQENFIYGVTSIAIKTRKKATSIAFFGDSLTNQGYYSDEALLSLYARHENLTGFNEGISGNRLLLSGTSNSEWVKSFGIAGVDRFQKQVLLYQPDIVVGLIGLNDLFQVDKIENPEELPSAEAMIAAYTQMKNLASARNIRCVFVTLPPFKGSIYHEGESWTAEKEEIRRQVNVWLRKQEYSIDLAEFVKDPTDEYRLDAVFDCGDHLHFSESGGKRIGQFVANCLEELFEFG